MLKPGTYYIKWEKEEETGFNYFTELLDTKIVTKEKANEKETITISSRSIIGIKTTPIEIAVSLSKPPAH